MISEKEEENTLYMIKLFKQGENHMNQLEKIASILHSIPREIINQLIF